MMAVEYFSYFKFLNSGTGILLILTVITNFLLLIWLYSKFIRRDLRTIQMMSKFNGPKQYLIVGNTFEVVIPNNQLMKKNVDVMNKYGRLVVGWMFNQPYVFIGEAKSAEKLLSSSMHIDKSDEYVLLEGWLGTGLLTSNGKKWHKRRKLLTPTFHFKVLEDFIHIFNEHASTLVRILEGRADGITIVNVFPYVARCTLDIICETAMGEILNAQRDNDSEYAKCVYEYGEMIVRRVVEPWLRINFIWNLFYGRKETKILKTLHDFTDKVIRKRKHDLYISRKKSSQETLISMNANGEKRRLAFLDLLLEVSEGGKVLSDMDIREEADTFMFEGQDTTAASVNWTIFLLASNPECQELVRQELHEVLGEDGRKNIEMADLSRLKYLEYCIKESLRLYPSVPFFARNLFHDLDLGDGKVIPSGVIVFITTYTLHRDPDVFPNPEKFCPERFEPQNCLGRNPYAYIPFSAGPRNCIGQKFAMMEEKVILSKIFLNFKVEAAEKLEDVQIVPDLILRPKKGLHVKFTKI